MAYQNITPVRISQDTIPTGTTAKIIYRTPDNVRTYIKDINIANTSATNNIDVNVYIVPNGATVGTSTALLYSVPVAKNSYLHWVGTQILNPKDTIQVLADNAGGTITVSGGEAT